MDLLGNPSSFVAEPGDTGSLHGVDSPSGGLVDKASNRDSNGLNVDLNNKALTIRI
jgi:hypothetical protein